MIAVEPTPVDRDATPTAADDATDATDAKALHALFHDPAVRSRAIEVVVRVGFRLLRKRNRRRPDGYLSPADDVDQKRAMAGRA